MTPQQLESRTRFAVLSCVALVVAVLVNSLYQSSSLCLADMRWRSADDYRLVALQTAREGGVYPLLSADASDEALAAYLKANPECCLMGKHGYSEYDPPSRGGRILGRASKTVSLNTGVIPGSQPQMIGYAYVQMDNCGAPYHPVR
ncbi:MAG: hypothetical protein ACREEY_13765 [Brevundimonas sp.]